MAMAWPLAGLKATIIGLGREGTALARFLAGRGARVTASDLKGPEALAASVARLEGLDVRLFLGHHPPEVFDADVLFLSPGVPQEAPVVVEARRRGIPLSSETRLFTRLCPAPVIGITGSSGKTTTVSLVGRMLQAAGLRAIVGGNIGQPLIEHLDEIGPGDRVVMELSSFQLEGFGPATPPERAFPPGGWSPGGAAILNITPNHLDRHPSMESYVAAKAHILHYQGADDWAVLNADDAVTAGLSSACVGQVLRFSLTEEVMAGAHLHGDDLIWVPGPGQGERVCARSDLRLRGRHNVANVLAALAIAGAAGASAAAMAQVAGSFTGVEHRLELVRTRDGVAFYNDSIATSPERAIAAIHAFSEPLVLLAGGRDKHLPWDGWVEAVRERVHEVICFGEMAPMLERLLAAAGDGGPQVHICATLPEAVEVAARLARPGDVVLLAPGGTSFDGFADFEARGRAFRTAVLAL
ncbi:MAG: UDP-N-acetylmuramoyl-L-alanine--D-glutamate ligase [Anaerolineae bacterium]|nr:UDP-N-acetylmuramoyl-L-alanine--D-glutamate ligase [Anaerolineae bacterium]